MKKTTILKMLLVAVGLSTGVSAWGTDVTVNTNDKFTYSSGTCLNESYTDGGSTAKDAIGILVGSDKGDRGGTLSFGTTTTASKILLEANILISTGNSNNSYFKVIDQSSNELFALRISGSGVVTLTDGGGQSTATSGITTERTQVTTFGGNDYYKTRWTAVKAYFDFDKHYGLVNVGSKTYEITFSAASTGIKGFYLLGGKSHGASLVAKDYSTTEVSTRYAAGLDTYTNGNNKNFDGNYTDDNSVTNDAVGGYNGGESGNRYGTLTFGATTTASYINLTANILLQTGNDGGSATYFKALDQSGNELFAIRMTGENTTSVTLTDQTNTSGTQVMTASKRTDATIGNGTRNYGNTEWFSVSAYLNFSDHTGKVTIGSTDYEITLSESSTGMKGYYLQAGRGYGAVLLAKDYTVSVAAGPVTIKYVDGESNEIATSVSPSVSDKLAGETLSYSSHKFIVYEGDLYIIGNDASATSPTTNGSVTLNSEAQEISVTYTKKAEGEYYFYEFDGGYTTRTNYESNGSAICKTANVTVPATGVYIVTANCYGSNDNRTASINVGETTIVESTTISIYAPGTDLVSGEVSLTKDNIITVTTSSSTDGIDYVILQKICVTGTIASSGWSSLASAYALDFSSATNAAGYVVSSITKTTVTLTSVNQMPANSGVLLKGDASEAYSIPVIASASFEGTNKLQAAVTATDIAAKAAYILKGGAFCLVTEASTVPAGKAYLLASDVPSGSRSLSFAFGDEEFTTGINNANAKGLLDGEFYNLQGQRVDNPTKGLYIINGKKVIIK